MPTRYLKPGIRDSELIDQLSPMAETLFYRLIVTVDDFGRADARPAMVKAACYPIKAGITAEQCDTLLAELATVGLVDVYTVEGKPYLQLGKWDNAPRAKASKFPACEDGCAQVYADAKQHQSTNTHTCTQVHTDARNPRTDVPVTVTGTDNRNREPEPKKGALKFDPAAIELPDWLDREAWATWCSDRKARKKPITEAAAHLQVKQLGEYLQAGHLPEAVIAHSIAGGFQGLYPPKPTTPAAAPGRAPETFAERSERHARQRVADLIGGAAPSMHDTGDVIDVEPGTPRIEP
ncbi:MAG: hypothetical protein AB7V24_16170 [Steroidobacteraceae bacterium]